MTDIEAASPAGLDPAVDETVAVYEGECACGSVSMRFSVKPTMQVWCHCGRCRRHSGSHVRPSILIKPTSFETAEELEFADGEFEILKGKDKLLHEDGKCDINGATARRFFCNGCGCPCLAIGRPHNMISTPAGLFPDFTFQPQLHIFCGSICSDIILRLMKDDGLPKFKDIPAEYGGTGELCE